VTSGVYVITNAVTGDQYVGASGKVELRARTHRTALMRGAHCNKRLQAAWEQYGAANFTLKLVEPIELIGSDVADQETLKASEKRWIDDVRPTYNYLRHVQRAAEVGLDLWGTQIVETPALAADTG